MMARKRHRVCLSGVLFAALLLAAPAMAQRGGGPAGVHVAPVKRESLEAQRLVTGELRAVARSLVASQETGIVLDMPIDEGQPLRKGDVLASIDQRRLQIEKLRIEARLKVTTALLAERTEEVARRQRDYDAILALDQKSAARPNELADAESDLRISEARRDQAQRDAEVIQTEAALLDERIADTTIRAPFDGVIVSVHTEVGQWLGQGETVAEIVATHRYDAWIDVQQTFKPALAEPGATVLIAVDVIEGEAYEVTPRVIPQVDSSGRGFKAVARIDDPDGRMAPGMSVSGWIPTGQRGEFLTIPRDALLRNQAGFYVYVARPSPDGPQMAHAAPITIEFELADRVAVRSQALQPGDLVVTEGNERLFPMTPIVFEPPAATDGGGERTERGG